ncbi:hypothetical protein Pcinc_023188 [Petrolisthes cinctipes]|uniref:Major facilitator superfamily (MFS) profile domain-containing protein n=1 Tax=Petrolisthes cinctipes TaxID=88211 RepID=A0AAE1KCJ6_PETCI|nr:hypothetical protein Pcinc_023188 [Petrolisthes cinctipes]
MTTSTPTTMTEYESEGEWSPWGDGNEEELEQPLINPVQQQQLPEDRFPVVHMDDNRMVTPLVGGRASRTTQFIAAFSATMGALAMGAVLGFSSPAGPMLMKDPSLNFTNTQNTWFSSSLNLGALVGGPVGGVCLNTLGRRGTMLASALPFLGGWILIVLGKNFGVLLFGRIVTGLCAGITSLTVPTFIGEYSSADVRGTLGSGFQLMVTIGIVYVYSMGAAVTSFRTLAALCIIPVVIYFILMLFVKESPTFLLAKGKQEQAAKALQYFRGKSYNIQPELDMMRSAIQESNNTKVSITDFRKPYIFKPFLISLTLMFFQQFSGVNAVLFNLNSIFLDSGSSLSDNWCSIIVGLVQVAATFLATILMDRAGRKILLITSSSIMALSLVALGEFFYWEKADESWAKNTLGWLPLASLVIFIASFSIGYGPIPWLMMGELFSSDVKEMAASAATMFNWTLSFVVTSIFVMLQNGLGNDGSYWLFASICIVNLIFCVTLVPETKGKTLKEITALFGGQTHTSDTDTRNSSDC